MKTGIFGGTFNPIHNGHLVNARYVKEKFFLDRIIFIPSKFPVHKDLDGHVSAEHRLEMVRLSISDNIFFEVSRVEIDRVEESYTVLTVEELMRIYPENEFYVILGADAFMDIGSWKDIGKLSELVSFIVLNRPGYENPDEKISGLIKNYKFAGNPFYDISSSMIRGLIRKGISIRNLVPVQVEEYIVDKGLYRK